MAKRKTKKPSAKKTRVAGKSALKKVSKSLKARLPKKSSAADLKRVSRHRPKASELAPFAEEMNNERAPRKTNKRSRKSSR